MVFSAVESASRPLIGIEKLGIVVLLGKVTLTFAVSESRASSGSFARRYLQ
jgi:hypothetical protein